ncbi:S8 family peptidase [Umezawaea beigongshangensis]|uniref:S8 family peptidase n=1 Tax=Umezawaea beigongshangensis TaxID=2780383 RepID=UPI0018F2676B|nr:S8 family serine peptidase [Umezawaea beigongshangensis]
MRRLRHPILPTAASATAALVVAAVLVAPIRATAADEPPDTGTEALRSVTLITGDRVLVRGDRVAGVTAAPERAGTGFLRRQVEGHEHVVPLDAVPLLTEGRLDERLFDVTELLAQGMTDQDEPELPVIVTGAAGDELRAADVPAGAEVTTSVPSLGVRALSVDRSDAPAFWNSLREKATARASGAVDKIWLNGRVSASLDRTVPKIGAPRAWEQGFSAQGAKVAVLDTGYDPTHPDLVGRVDAAAVFTGEPDAVDRTGHGTHVASTIAGSGAASGGRYRGVAPDARLLVGKVLDDNGGGSDAEVIAGMAWAVQQGARVVNMSLGSRPTDGTDLLSQKLNELSESSGALFVVSAGNSGPNGVVTAPSTADRALSVASTTVDDVVSDFSSTGPRRGDLGLKPEIAAPGSDVVAARAAGTLARQAVDEHHARLSGTSMASPHVAGAAAIVAGQHPEWTGQQIKAALTGTAEVLPDAPVFRQGAGRVDVADAVRSTVRGQEATLGAGLLRWPHDDTEPVVRTQTYHNDGDQPVTARLDLQVAAVDGARPPEGMFSLDHEEIVIPARGSASVSVTTTRANAWVGRYAGRLTATTAEGSLTTPFAVGLDVEKRELTVRTLGRDGEPALANVMVQNEDTGFVTSALTAGGVFTERVPLGRYRVIGQVVDVQDGFAGGHYSDLTEFAIGVEGTTGDGEVVVDAREGRPLTTSVQDPHARKIGVSAYNVSSSLDTPGGRSSASTLFYGTLDGHHAIGAAMPGLRYGFMEHWDHPMASVRIPGADGVEVQSVVDNSAGHLGSVRAPLVDVGDGATETLPDVTGAVALIADEQPVDQEVMNQRVRALAERGAVFVLSYNYVPDHSTVPVFQLFGTRDVTLLRARLAAGPAEVEIEGRLGGPSNYHLSETVRGELPSGRHWSFRDADLGTVQAEYRDLDSDHRTEHVMNVLESDGISGVYESSFRSPHRRVEHYSPGTTWQALSTSGYDTETGQPFGGEESAPWTPRAGERRAQCWRCGVFGPQLPEGGAAVVRDGDALAVDVQPLSVGDPTHRSPSEPHDTRSTVLLRDGVEIGRSDAVGPVRFALPAEDSAYRLVVAGTRVGAHRPMGDSVSVEWAFRSAGGRQTVSLLDVRFALPLDEDNALPADTATSGTVSVVRQGGAAAETADLGVEVSYDDGVTWLAAPVSRTGQDWTVALPAGGAAGGFVSLRATASDVEGNSVVETALRAYRLR